MQLELKLVAEGLGFPEGPVAMPDGSVIFVDIKEELLLRWSPVNGTPGKPTLVAEVPGGPNGVAVGPDGFLYVCNNGGVYKPFGSFNGATIPGRVPPDYRGGSIQRVDPANGHVQPLYDSCDGKPLLAPDDIVFDRDGGFWFTVSGYQDEDLLHKGGLFYASTDGQRIVKAATIPMANGVGLSPDGATIYVSDTLFGRLWALEIVNPGSRTGQVKPGPLLVMPGRVVQTLPGFQWLDSLAVEASGRICVGTIFNGGITIFHPTDGSTEHVAIPDMFTTNLCFGGADMQDVWITASSTGKLYQARWPRPGLPLAFPRSAAGPNG